MSSTAEKTDYLQQGFQSLQQRNGAPGWIQELRETGRSRFEQTGFPSTRQEEWRFTDITPLKKQAFQLAEPAVDEAALRQHLADCQFDGLDSATMVFVNGRYCPSLSDLEKLGDKLTVQSLAASMDHEIVKSRLGQIVPVDATPLVALNAAFLDDGAFIHVPKGVVEETPIHLVFLATGEATFMCHPRNLIVAEAGSQVTIIESYAGTGDQTYWTNAVTEIETGDASVVDHYKMQRESLQAFHLAYQGSRHESQAVFASHNVSFGGGLARTDTKASLEGQFIDCTLNGLYLGAERQLVDNHTDIEVTQPNCRSFQVYKGILDDKASGVFNGRIHVLRAAQKTDAKQTNRALLLSKRAQINTKPELLIFADDVKCTHGATIGQLDKDQIFYLRSRGLSREAAVALLTAAFGGEAIDDMKLEPIRLNVAATMLAKFQN